MVTVIVPAYNEEKTIQGKLENLLEMEYPADKMEIIVVDDGSTDNTAEIVQLFIDKGIKLLLQRERMGKIYALNLAFSHAQGDILITTDADVCTSATILKEVIPYFADQRVGAVCASQKLVNVNESRSTLIESYFQSFYTLLRRAESVIDSTIVFNGEFSAMRKGLLSDIPAEAGVDDVEIPIMVRKRGYRCILTPEANFYDFAPSKFSVSWKQKIRRSQGIIRALWRHKDAFLNGQYDIYGKLIFPAEFYMNVLSPYFLLATIFSGISLLIVNQYVAFIIFTIMLSTICVALFFIYFKLKSYVGSNGVGPSFLWAAWNLFLAQFLLFLGSLRCLLGGGFHKWEKIEDTRRFS